ncbi:MAG: urease accessory protein UreD [Hyphomicrobium sp.]|jgi:urease accessory protein
MSGATSRCDAGIIASSAGIAEVSFRRRGDETVLAHLYQQAPLRVLFPRTQEPGTPVAALVSTAGGLVGGDRVLVRVHLEQDASAVVMSGAAEKVYRSNGGTCRVLAELSVQEGGRLDYLPHETIVFEAARVDRTTAIDLAPDCRVLAGGMLVFGRSASGEVLSSGYIRDAWEIRKNGRLLWADALLMEGDLLRPLAASACLGSAAAIAMMIFAGDDAVAQLALARELLEAHTADDDTHRSGATMVAGLIIVRWIGPDARRLRTVFGAFLAAFRHLVAGRQPSLPRLWSV